MKLAAVLILSGFLLAGTSFGAGSLVGFARPIQREFGSPLARRQFQRWSRS